MTIFSVEKLAELCKVDRETVRRWRNRGVNGVKLEARQSVARRGAALLFDDSAVKAFMEANPKISDQGVERCPRPAGDPGDGRLPHGVCPGGGGATASWNRCWSGSGKSCCKRYRRSTGRWPCSRRRRGPRNETRKMGPGKEPGMTFLWLKGKRVDSVPLLRAYLRSLDGAELREACSALLKKYREGVLDKWFARQKESRKPASALEIKGQGEKNQNEALYLLSDCSPEDLEGGASPFGQPVRCEGRFPKGAGGNRAAPDGLGGPQCAPAHSNSNLGTRRMNRYGSCWPT